MRVEVGSSNIEKAAIKVCRNPKHLPQIVALMSRFLGNEGEESMTVEKLVNLWWKKQLFLSIDLGSPSDKYRG